MVAQALVNPNLFRSGGHMAPKKYELEEHPEFALASIAKKG
jgi:hypothetical protein